MTWAVVSAASWAVVSAPACSVVSATTAAVTSALIWAAAKENGISLIYSEDFQDGRTIEGVRIVNPLAGLPKAP